MRNTGPPVRTLFTSRAHGLAPRLLLRGKLDHVVDLPLSVGDCLALRGLVPFMNETGPDPVVRISGSSERRLQRRYLVSFDMDWSDPERARSARELIEVPSGQAAAGGRLGSSGETRNEDEYRRDTVEGKV